MSLWTECCNCWKQFGCLLRKANKLTLWGFISLHPPLNKGEERWLYGSVNVCIIFKDWKPGGISIADAFFSPFLYLSFNKKSLILSQSCSLLSWARLPWTSITVLPGQCSQACLTPPYRSNPGLRHTSRLWGATPISINVISCGELSHGIPRTCKQLSRCLVLQQFGCGWEPSAWEPKSYWPSVWIVLLRIGLGVIVALLNATSVLHWAFALIAAIRGHVAFWLPTLGTAGSTAKSPDLYLCEVHPSQNATHACTGCFYPHAGVMATENSEQVKSFSAERVQWLQWQG